MAESHHPNYKKIYLILLVLLVISVAGPFLGILWVTLLTAFGIAIVKANLVIQNFMHLKWEKDIMKWMLASSLLLMFLLFAGVAPDVLKHEGTRWENVAAREAIVRGVGGGDHGEDEEHLAAADEEHAEEAADAGEGAEGEAAAAVAAQEFDARGAYTTVCATCHGPAGAGDGPGSAALDPKPANFGDPAFWASRDEADLVRVIREGGMAVGKSALMPAWGALYDEAKAQAIVDYLKTFASEG